MISEVVTDVFKRHLLEAVTLRPFPHPAPDYTVYLVRLYGGRVDGDGNYIDPLATDVIGDYLPFEATWEGYRPIQGGLFVFPFLEPVLTPPDEVLVHQHNTLDREETGYFFEFTNTGLDLVEVQGYFLTDVLGTVLLGAGDFNRVGGVPPRLLPETGGIGFFLALHDEAIVN